jgi:hypothetical protein
MSIKEILEELAKLRREERQQLRTWLDSEDFPEMDALLGSCRRRVPFHGTETHEEPRIGSGNNEAMRYQVEIAPQADDDLAPDRQLYRHSNHVLLARVNAETQNSIPGPEAAFRLALELEPVYAAVATL